MKNIVIFGASGHGSVILDCLIKEAKYNVVGFIDSSKKKNSLFCGYQVLGKESDLQYLIDKYNVCGGIVAIGDNWTRSLVVDKVYKFCPGFRFITTIHPSVIVSRDVVLGSGVAILAGVRINANSKIGDHCILNTNSILEHDGIMNNFSSLAPMACVGGGFLLGEFSALCLGAKCIDGITVGDHVVVGAGSVVLNDIPDNVVAFGTPAEIKNIRKIGAPYMGGQKRVLEMLFKDK